MKRGLDHQQGLADWAQLYCAQQAAGSAPVLETALEHCAGLSAAWEAIPGLISPNHLVQKLQLLELLGLDETTLAAVVLDHVSARRGQPGEELWPDAPRPLRKLASALAECGRYRLQFSSVEQGAEGVRRLLLALIADVRALVVEIAEQVVLMRAAAQVDSDLRSRLARQTRDIYAPLANRLGIAQLKWELEDLQFRYLAPEAYKAIAGRLAERRESREAYIERVCRTLAELLAQDGIRATVSGRPKHIYSIHRKMEKKRVSFDELYDIRAFRVLVDDVHACYVSFGLIHAAWPPIQSEIDDYIAQPKPNGYRSLHTAVIGPEGQTIEIQIRTHEMHEHAELGVAAHWLYKDRKGADAALERRIQALRSVLAAATEEDAAEAIGEALAGEGMEDRVYVLTPKGAVINLPQGATVLDFAYHIHTEIGHRCRGAKVGGKLVPLTYALKSGDQVEILTRPQPEPSRDWLYARAGYLHTASARAKLRQWFRRIDHDRLIHDGRAALEREVRRLASADLDLTPVLARFRLHEPDELYLRVGNGEITPLQVFNVLQELRQAQAEPLSELRSVKPSTIGADRMEALTIAGIDNLMIQPARCCRPIPGDEIRGYVTRGRGVSVHRQGCAALARLLAREPEREIDVEWGRAQGRFPVAVEIVGESTVTLLRDIANVLVAAEIPIEDSRTQRDPRSGLTTARLVVDVAGYVELSTVLGRIDALPQVRSARRLS